MTRAIVKAVGRMDPNQRSAQLIEAVKALLSRGGDAIQGADYNRGAKILMGRDADTNMMLRRGSAGVMEKVMNAASELGVTKGTPAQNKVRAYEMALSPGYSAAMRAVPAASVLGTAALGGAAIDAVTESEDERKLREALEIIGYYS